MACLNIPADEAESLASSLKERPLAGAIWKPHGEWTLLIRAGALPGSANWTHEHADAANTRVSRDSRVKAPLGLLWFGGASNDDILPRHGHGPQPQVVDGRLIIQGMDLLRATDVYTGRVLWETKLPGIGALYDNTAHQPGANASGTNYISTPAGIYVAYRDACLVLDPATGKERQKFQLPLEDGAEKPPLWGYLNVDGEYLIGGADPVFDPKLVKNASKPRASSKSSLLDAAKAGGLARDDRRQSSLQFVHRAVDQRFALPHRFAIRQQPLGKQRSSAHDGVAAADQSRGVAFADVLGHRFDLNVRVQFTQSPQRGSDPRLTDVVGAHQQLTMHIVEPQIAGMSQHQAADPAGSQVQRRRASDASDARNQGFAEIADPQLPLIAAAFCCG